MQETDCVNRMRAEVQAEELSKHAAQRSHTRTLCTAPNLLLCNTWIQPTMYS